MLIIKVLKTYIIGKFWVCFTALTFMSIIFREFGLWIIGKANSNNCIHNVLWIKSGFSEYCAKMNNNPCIFVEAPMEFSMSYINHLLKCVYNE